MLLIDKLTVVTMDEQRNILTDAAIAIENERIIAVGASADLRDRFANADVLDGDGMVALPGLIDTHAHADQALLRGLGYCMHWVPFLDDVVEPYLAQRDPADGVLANTLAMMEMLRGGTTCFVSPNVDPRDDYEALTAAVGKLGIRAVLGRFIGPHDGADNDVNAQKAVVNASAVMSGSGSSSRSRA